MTTSRASVLLTDLYQLTMMSAYFELGMEQPAVFEFSVRRQPERRNFLVAAGLEQVLEFLESLHFTEHELEWLAKDERFKPSFLDRLRTLRFSGDVYAVREGTVFFEDEPILRVVAPLPQGQLIESRIINLLNLQTSVASKAARCRLAAQDRTLTDFGMRRAHGEEAAVFGARASFIGGFDATACVEAARQFDIPMSGTMAHSFVQAHEDEGTAFGNFARCHPNRPTLLIDTYDIESGAHKVCQVARVLAKDRISIGAVRIDSGDLAAEAKRVRAILDAGGCRDVKILVSGNLDEDALDRLVRAGAPIDGFGVGTKLSVSDDAPALDCAYKLQEYAGRPRCKLSASKTTWPGRRQVHRVYDEHGRIGIDMIGRADEVCEGKPLLHPVMTGGKRQCAAASLHEIRDYCRVELATLPPTLRALEHGPRPPIKISPGLHALAERMGKPR